ncbi:NifC-like ABC-type porter [Syntrophobotulus glycolicus DSM 8271]|uniref:NifC-like ABC-type porter n=1 Tax=Syntrophobotulus glycolicus (strain DSM 8271 / FlGlyR) TaxID=645991 RepID=F0SW06_SYNGF|nr:ABC transporter permease [Syntrophobotulus glycolicus]ADY56790.1 NifC-like ABC-type porter [Syntrophobotulus glycolicus DSM 8271]
MALKLKWLKAAKKHVFLGSFWLTFILTSLFFLIIIIGLCTYSDFATIVNVVKQPEFHFAIKFTLWTSLTAAFFAVLTALPCGYVLSRFNFPGRAVFDTLVDIPIVLPPLVSGIALLICFGPVLGERLAKAGINIVFTPLGVVVAQWFIAAPYAIKSFMQAFNGVDRRMENVARTLGFSPAQVFLKVSLPLAKGGIIGGIMMAWARSLGEFGATAMLAGITRMKTETLSVAIFLNMSIGEIKFAISTAIVMLSLASLLLVVVKIAVHNEEKV